MPFTLMDFPRCMDVLLFEVYPCSFSKSIHSIRDEDEAELTGKESMLAGDDEGLCGV